MPDRTKKSRKGKVPDDWAKQGVQIPRRIMKDFRKISGEFGHGGVKIIGTAALALIMGMDERDRDTICRYVFQKTHRDANNLDERRVYELLRALMLEKEKGQPGHVEPVWFVDKILDPEVTPEPGKKASDLSKGTDGGKETA